MKLMLGDNLKQLRKEQDLTQEQLASILGVSYQSVSRWENNLCYPDIELLPVIADFFKTTVDKLLGINEQLEKQTVEACLSQFQQAISRGDVQECIRITREGVAKYPNNYVLLNKLMYALFIAGDDSGNIPDWKENMQKYDKEITSLGERIMKYCPDQEIRLEATARLAFNHCEMGRKEVGRAIYETLPSIHSCREGNIWWALNDDEKLPFLRSYLKSSYSLFHDALYTLTVHRLLPDEELIQIYEKILVFDNLIFDGQIPNNGWGHCLIRVHLAETYARLGQTAPALEQLTFAAEFARQFDLRPDSDRFHCLLFGTMEMKRDDFETADSRSCREIMRDKWLAVPDFDCIRNSDAFQEMITRLSMP